MPNISQHLIAGNQTSDWWVSLSRPGAPSYGRNPALSGILSQRFQPRAKSNIQRPKEETSRLRVFHDGVAVVGLFASRKCIDMQTV
eukprot:6452131-Amphidinium_carterae.2